MSDAVTPVNPVDAVGNIVTAISGWAGDQLFSMGRVVAFDEDPSFLIERPDGTRFSWRASWCREPTQEELNSLVIEMMKQPVYPHTTGGTK